MAQSKIKTVGSEPRLYKLKALSDRICKFESTT